MICANLQAISATGEDHQPPVLRLFRYHCTLRRADCKMLCERDARRYFEYSGASVILLAELRPEENYVLQISTFSSRSKQCGKADTARLYVNSDGPIALEEIEMDSSQ